MKVERVSYDIITPSAARAIFEAILWKPAIRWRVTRIEVLAPLRWASVRRNEVAGIASDRNTGGLFIEDQRQQRAGLLLRDVRYRLHAEFDFILPAERQAIHNPIPEFLRDPEEEKLSIPLDEKEGKYAAMFDRRSKRGQVFNQPYLGCREFSCSFRRVESSQPYEVPADWKGRKDLGLMLYDLDYADPRQPTPLFFRAKTNDGVMEVPPRNSEEVRG
ncbi:MAG: type I-C CRISPR-associated protein Cas5c [Planctomycetes bacterium]|nr:type I-C CRISPR-associated protein Cas5c [Planctomycetota bacterium]